MMSLKPRRLLRGIMGIISRGVIKKHKPEIIVVFGNGQTSIVREAIYEIVHSTKATRRNLEFPEAEFSIPLTIIGHASYPIGYLEWGQTIVKSLIKLLKNKPFNHTLILEISSLNREIFEFWLKTLKPNFLINVGKKIDLTKPDVRTGYIESLFENELSELKIKKDFIKAGLEKLVLPISKIRILRGINNSLIIDNRHYYYPNPPMSALELAETMDGDKYIFTPLPSDIEYVKSSKKNWQIINSNFEPKKGDVILLRGKRVSNNTYVKNLIRS